MRAGLRPPQEGPARGHRTSRALPGGLRAQAGGPGPAGAAGAHRQEGGRHRQRSGRPHVRRDARPRRATASRSSRLSTSPGASSSTASPSSGCPSRSSADEVRWIEALGVELRTDAVIGRLFTIDELMDEQGFDAAFIGVGAGAPVFMGIPGEHNNGVFSANEFLTRANLMKAYQLPSGRHPDHQRRAGRRHRWRQRGHGLRAHGPQARGAHGAARLPAQRGGDARAAGGGPPREGGGHRVHHAHQSGGDHGHRRLGRRDGVPQDGAR